MVKAQQLGLRLTPGAQVPAPLGPAFEVARTGDVVVLAVHVVQAVAAALQELVMVCLNANQQIRLTANPRH